MRTRILIIITVITAAALIAIAISVIVANEQSAQAYTRCIVAAQQDYPHSDGPAADAYRRDLDAQCGAKYQH